ncbi:uncharacterized protein LOC144586834 [Pogona vitticeps]
MLFHSLIVLCIGIYGSCMPTHKATSSSTSALLLDGFNEIFEHFRNVKDQKPTMIPRNTSMTHAEIPEMEKKCFVINLERYRNLFNSLDIKGPKKATEAYANMVAGLNAFSMNQDLTEYLPPQTKEKQDCETSSEDIKELLKEFERFLKELYLLLEKTQTQ